jgi:hypothetical protein
VLYIDAADQADASTQQPLLPGPLRTLPPGVLCVITSRPRLDWLRTEQAVTVWDLDDYADDRADVRAYLHQKGPRLSPPLGEAFIDQAVTQADPPVFFTVASCLRRLESGLARASDASALRENPALWVVPAEERIRTEALRVLAEAEAQGISETRVWQTLGLHAVAQEPLSKAQLEALELWEAETTDQIVRLAANFFRARPLSRQPEVPYHFDHPGYRREVLTHLTPRDIVHLHRLLADGCGRCWQDFHRAVSRIRKVRGRIADQVYRLRGQF